MLEENGVFRASIPSDGTLFWTLGLENDYRARVQTEVWARLWFVNEA